ncbi:transcriptional regulator, MarR family protein [Calothrix sp. NIES-4071]|nr:transcriptional regulator, MarR family protein [Calothrix sp. NIES-4071]BAZ55414.1 transcriptional regulator, MarR family protein [Calothrix sp. NIES-4105]
MTTINTKQSIETAASEAFYPTLSALVSAYHAYRTYSDAHVRQLGLTSSQFDVICALGNASGMNFNKLAQKTLTTKGELTGIVDRLEKKGLVRREVPPNDRRSFLAVLTPEGKRIFEEVFPAHTEYLKECFATLDIHEFEEIRIAIEKLRKLFP